jgi:hypothetical protein
MDAYFISTCKRLYYIDRYDSKFLKYTTALFIIFCIEWELL